MSTLDEILTRADEALAAAAAGEPDARRRAIGTFMQCFEQLAREVAAGATSWEAAAPWAARTADQVRAAGASIKAWDAESADLLYSPSGGEEEMDAALRRRSRLAFAREVFRGTAADEVLAALEEKEFDHDLHEEAVRIEMFAPSHIPRSHTWWARPDET